MRAPSFFAAVLTSLSLVWLLGAGPVRAATILVYHSFGGHTSMSMSVADFEAQLEYLDRAGYKVIPLKALTDCLDARRTPPDKAVVLAFDDGWSSFMRVFPLLTKRKLPFTLFLPLAYIATPGNRTNLSQADITALRASPLVTFADHSWLHSARVATSETLAREDIRKSRKRFHQLFGYDTPYFTFPYGRSTAMYMRLLHEAGFRYLFVTGFRPPMADTPLTAIPRIAAHRLTLPRLASVLRLHTAMLARAKPRPAPAPKGPLLTETSPDRSGPRLME